MTGLLTFMSERLGYRDQKRALVPLGMRDVIADMLQGRRPGENTTARLRAAAPWGIKQGHASSMTVHLVTQGWCWLRVPEVKPLRLGPGDLALLPNGAGHALSSDRHGSLILDEDVLDRPAAGSEIDIAGNGPETRILCAGYRSRDALPAGLAAMLPPVMHVGSPQLATRRDLAETLRMLEYETNAALPGSQILIDRLIDILAVHVLRSWLPAESAAWPTPRYDRAVATAVTALHRDIDRPWTLNQLAERVGLSRATLTRRFTLTIGQPPLSYLRQQRMELAAHRLRDTDDTLASIAKRVGYTSEFAFSRAFSRTIGMAPSSYRSASRGTHTAAGVSLQGLFQDCHGDGWCSREECPFSK